jgi:hypothetical protein
MSQSNYRPKTPESNKSLGDKRAMPMTAKSRTTSYDKGKSLGGASDADLQKGFTAKGKLKGTDSDKGFA